MEEKKINWDKWGVIIAVVSIVIGFFGWNAASCLGCVSCPGNDGDGGGTTSSVVSKPDDVESIPTESEIQAEIEQKSGKRYIENVKVLSVSNPYNCDYKYPELALANTGDTYSHNLLVECDMRGDEEESIELYLNEQYNDFTLTVALSDETRDLSEPHKVTIFCDGKSVWSKQYKSGTLPENLCLDVSGVTVLKFVFTHDGVTYWDWTTDCDIIIGDAYFTLAESE